MNTAEIINETFEIFKGLANIPRPSHHEARAIAWIAEFAQKNGWQTEIDAKGNLRIDLPASAGKESLPVLALQAHADMVCVAAEGVEKDFLTEGIELVRNGDILSARGTSLGADDGMGIVAALQFFLHAAEISHPPLRAIFTVDEEENMSGAEKLSAAWLADVAWIVNIDFGQNEDVACIGCAGARAYHVTTRDAAAQFNFRMFPECDTFEFSISGLIGGHSGMRIHEGRPNAIVSAARFLAGLDEKSIAWHLAEFCNVGGAENAIASNARAVFAVEKVRAADLQAAFDDFVRTFRATYPTEASITLRRVPNLPAADELRATVDYILCAGDGVNTMSQFQNGLVESSNNFGIVTVTSSKIEIVHLARSLNEGRFAEMHARFAAAARLNGMEFYTLGKSFIWPPKVGGKLQNVWTEATLEVLAKPPTFCTEHVGLECGMFLAKNPALEIISTGPQLNECHTPREHFDLASHARFLKVLRHAAEKFD